MSQTKLWFKHAIELQKVRVWLLHDNADKLAAGALWRLNKLARHGESKHQTYAFKTYVLELLYKKGYCTGFTTQRQTLYCYRCSGTGESEWEEDGQCAKCDGTGIFAEHILYLFSFTIAGQSYQWHQPSGLAAWASDLSKNKFEADISEYRDISYGAGSIKFDPLDICILYWYCRMNGISKADLPHFPSLIEVIRTDLRHLYYREIVYKAQPGNWRNAIWKIFSAYNQWQAKREYDQLGDIPF